MLGLGTLLIVSCGDQKPAATPELNATVVAADTKVPEANKAPTPQLATTTAATPTVTSTLQPEATETPTSVPTATIAPGPTADKSPASTTQLATTTAATPTVTSTLQPEATETPTIAPTPETPTTPSSSASSNPPTDLALPFRIEDVGGGNEFISPFGIIRHSRDTGIGHGGIDIPLNQNAPIYAVADGTILSAEVSSDGAGGSNVLLLISGSDGKG